MLSMWTDRPRNPLSSSLQRPDIHRGLSMFDCRVVAVVEVADLTDLRIVEAID